LQIVKIFISLKIVLAFHLCTTSSFMSHELQHIRRFAIQRK